MKKLFLGAAIVLSGFAMANTNIEKEKEKKSGVPEKNKSIIQQPVEMGGGCLNLLIWDGCRKKGQRWIWHWIAE